MAEHEQIVPLSPLALPVNRRKGVRLTPEERKAAQEAFLKALANTANIRAASLQAGIHPSTVTYWKEHDEAFMVRFKEANDQANWLLFGEAWRRAVQGDERYVVSLGKLVYGPDGKPLTIREKSDRLLELLLKARLPEFREKAAVTVNVLPKEYVNLPQDGVDR